MWLKIVYNMIGEGGRFGESCDSSNFHLSRIQRPEHRLNKRMKSEKPHTDRVVEGLSLAIHEHRLSPGAKLNEDEVCDVFGVSRTIARAALQELSHSQLVTLERNRGAFVAKPTTQEAREVFEARSLLEPRTARSAAERMTAPKLKTLKDRIAQEHDAVSSAEPGRALYASGQFHIEIARIADQATILRFIEILVARSALIIALYWRRQSAMCESYAHHALLDAFANQDAQAAEELMQSHLVDIVSSLDLTERDTTPKPLKTAILGDAVDLKI